MTLDRRPRIALVGYGYWGPNLLRNLVAIDPGVVSWVCDRSADRLQEAHRQYPGLRTTTSLDRVLSDPETEAVMLALPPPEQRSAALQALAAGKHLFVEKPIGLSLGEVRSLVEAAEKAGRLLMEGLVYRYHTMINRIGTLIREQALGKVHCVYSQRANLHLRPKYTNVIWTLAPHDVSILRAWLGGSPVRVSTHARCVTSPDLEDVAFIEMEFPGNAFAHVYLSWLDPIRTRRIVVVGSEKIAIYDEVAAPLSVSIYNNLDACRQGPQDLSDMEGWVCRLGQPTEVVGSGRGLEEPLRTECRHFLECLVEGSPPLTGGAESIEVTRVIEEIHRSRKGRRKRRKAETGGSG